MKQSSLAAWPRRWYSAHVTFMCVFFIALLCVPPAGIVMKADETALGDYLVLLRRIATSGAIQAKMSSVKWTKTLLSIAGHQKESSECFARAVHLFGTLL